MLAERLCFMGQAKDHHQSAFMPQKDEMKLVFPASPLAVRNALKASITGLAHLKLSQDEKGVIEIVLAEVLNNVVEHAYKQHRSGVIEMRVKRQSDRLLISVLDDGVPMPNHDLPTSAARDVDVPIADLPEGGFGWFLIKELTQDLHYKRSGIRNQLDFTILLKDTSLN